MKRILMIGTGGTIASGKTAEGLMPELTSEQLLAFVPAVSALCRVECLQLLSLDSTMMNLCSMALVNSGNTYNLYKRVCERGYITPILFKSYALYTTRGAVTEPTRYLDWFLPYTVQTEE